MGVGIYVIGAMITLLAYVHFLKWNDKFEHEIFEESGNSQYAPEKVSKWNVVIGIILCLLWLVGALVVFCVYITMKLLKKFPPRKETDNEKN